MKAILKNARISSRKMGLAAKLVRNFKVTKADVVLKYAMKKSANILRKLIASAVANAAQIGKDIKDLMIKNIFVGPGVTYKRYMCRAKGSASPILKRTSNVLVILDVIDDNHKDLKKVKKHIINDSSDSQDEVSSKKTKPNFNIQKTLKDELNPKKENNLKSENVENHLKGEDLKKNKKSKKIDDNDNFSIFEEDEGGI